MTDRRGAAELQLEPSEQVLDRSVTLARAMLQSHAIKNVHATVRIADDAFLLQPLATTFTVWREEPSIIARNSWLS